MNETLNTGNCQLCDATTLTSIYKVALPATVVYQLAVCQNCLNELVKKKPDNHYWRFLSEAMWSEHPGVQVLAWRMLNRLNNEAWAVELLDQLYLDDELLTLAKEGLEVEETTPVEVHRDCLGNELCAGDTVVLTRSLDVKGSQLNVKMGTVVKHIRLVAEDTDQVEGKIDGQMIVILTKYLRKQKS